MIKINKLRKCYDDLVAVDSISFQLNPSETFGLLGPNGAGKTTTLNMIVGVLEPDEGTVDIDGGGSPTRPEVRRRIGNAPQALSLYAELTAEENLRFFGRLYKLSGRRLKERVDWSLALAGLTSRRSDRVSTFSGGMQRRLNMACAMIHDPPVLLLDEPTVGVDPQSRNAIFDSIEELKSEGRTIVYTTHYMEEAQRLCDRVAIMDNGKILALDTVNSLITNHGGNSIVEVELASPPDDPSRLPGRIEGTHLRAETDKPLEMVAQLAQSGYDFISVNVDHADLETVFLNLTGRSLRD